MAGEVIDRRVPVCAFFDEQNRLRGVIASASCHAVCNMDQNLSADYPSVLTRKAEYHYPDVPFLFLQGRGADVNPCMGGEAGIEKLGQELAESVFAALNQMKGNGLSRGPIDRQYRTVPVPMCIPPREKMEQELSSLVQQIRATEDVHERHTQSIEFVWRQKMLRILEKGKNPVVEADLALVIVGGEFALAFVSFELLTLTGNSIEEMLMQRGISADKCFVIGYTNQTNGYLAPSAESGMDGYETRGAAHWYGLPECCAESERTVLRTFSVMAEELFGE